MFDLFKVSEGFARSKIEIPSRYFLNRASTIIYSNYNDYYQTRYRFVNNAHLFVRLLTFLERPVNASSDDVIGYARDMMRSLAKTFHLTSYLNYGEAVYPGVFYGKNATELYIATDERFDVVDEASAIMTYHPIRVISHDRSSINYPYLNGSFVGEEGEIVTLVVNVPMLLWQYHLWHKLHEDMGSAFGTPSHFVSMCLIPSLMPSHMAIVTANRIMNHFYGMPNDETPFRHPMKLLDIRERYGKYCNDLAAQLEGTRFLYSETLSNIKDVTGTPFLDTIRLIETPINVNNRWVFFFAYAKYYMYLIELNEAQKNNANNSTNNALSYQLRAMVNEQQIVSHLRQGDPSAIVQMSNLLERMRISLKYNL